jgi:hypothetical protein
MNTLDVFKRSYASLNAQIKDKNSEYVRVEVQGLEVDQIYLIAGETVEIAGFDESMNETLLICPLGHFSARLSFAPKARQKKQLGFVVEPAGKVEKLM